MDHHYGPMLPVADQTHADKYRMPNEDFRASMNRISYALSDSDDHYKKLREILLSQRFLPAGRIQTAMGSSRRTTPYNCFVAPTIEDSFTAGKNSIMGVAHDAAVTMRLGGGIGYDFSTLRPRGSNIKKLNSKSSGPVSFMPIFDSIGIATSSAGHRRGAQMGVLRVDHPDIEEFILAKQNTNRLTGFNISVAVTEEFMNAVENDTSFTLRFDATPYRDVRARDLWEMLMRSTYDWAEPGIIFIDAINRNNNLWYCETIAATNPCGEQPLPPFGACLLGSFNLSKYLTLNSSRNPTFNSYQLLTDIPVIVRAMDNVIDRASYPLHEQEQEAINKRRMGLGVTGLANALEAMGQPYGSEAFVEQTRAILTLIRDNAYLASTYLAAEKGSFPLYRKEQYLAGKFIRTLPEHIREGIAERGMRNSHLLSIAPTGTISLTADNVSSGIEPVFSVTTRRALRTFDAVEVVEIEDYGYRVFGTIPRTANEVTPDEHLAVLAVASSLVDSAVSKTCNVPTDISWEDFKDIYFSAWKLGCKGCTTYRMGGKREGILKRVESKLERVEQNEDNRDKVVNLFSSSVPTTVIEDLSCTIDPETGDRSCE